MQSNILILRKGREQDVNSSNQTLIRGYEGRHIKTLMKHSPSITLINVQLRWLHYVKAAVYRHALPSTHAHAITKESTLAIIGLLCTLCPLYPMYKGNVEECWIKEGVSQRRTGYQMLIQVDRCIKEQCRWINDRDMVRHGW